MSWEPDNPVVIGGATKATDYNSLWDNAIIGRDPATGEIITAGNAGDGLTVTGELTALGNLRAKTTLFAEGNLLVTEVLSSSSAIQSVSSFTGAIHTDGGLGVTKDVFIAGVLNISTGSVVSGTYTPTLTNVTNVAASTAFVCQYMRVGNAVTVSGQVDIDVTSASISTQLDMSLPIASNFALAGQCGGSASNFQLSSVVGQPSIRAKPSTNTAAFVYTCGTSTANLDYFFSFTYQII